MPGVGDTAAYLSEVSPSRRLLARVRDVMAASGDGATRLETMVSDVAQSVLGTTTVERDGSPIDLRAPWQRVTLRDAMLAATGLDLNDRPSREQLADAVGRAPVPPPALEAPAVRVERGGEAEHAAARRMRGTGSRDIEGRWLAAFSGVEAPWQADYL